jgi:hypothetical protein
MPQRTSAFRPKLTSGARLANQEKQSTGVPAVDVVCPFVRFLSISAISSRGGTAKKRVVKAGHSAAFSRAEPYERHPTKLGILALCQKALMGHGFIFRSGGANLRTIAVCV